MTYFDSTVFPFSTDFSWDGTLKSYFLACIWLSIMYWSKIITLVSLGERQPSVFMTNDKDILKAKKIIFHQMIVLQKLWKMFFYFILKALFVLEIFKFLYFRLPLFFSLSAIALEVDPRKILKFMMSSTV